MEHEPGLFRAGGDGLQTFPADTVDGVYRLCYSGLICDKEKSSNWKYQVTRFKFSILFTHFCPDTRYSFLESYLYVGRKDSADKLCQAMSVRWDFFILGSFPVMHTPEPTL